MGGYIDRKTVLCTCKRTLKGKLGTVEVRRAILALKHSW